VLLQFLLDRVSEAAQGSITVHYNSSVESLGMPTSVDDAAGVATLRVVDTGSGGVTEFCSQRVLGCDGLNSTSIV
jgi:2-polyprenyl-6-methoxyphenol hydroxylase-like FAD-dependent oxidoreductase